MMKNFDAGNVKKLNKIYAFIVISIVVFSIFVSKFNFGAFTMISEIIFILIPVLFLVKEERGELNARTLYLNKIDRQDIIFSFIIPIFTYPLFNIINSIITAFLPSVDITGSLEINDTKTIMLQIFFLAIIPSICEELLFRSYFLPEFRKNGEIYAILYVAFLFSLTHLNPYNFVIPFLLGLLLNHITLITRSAIPAIIIHCVNNILALFLADFQFGVFLPKEILMRISTSEIVLFVMLLTLFCTGALFLILRKFSDKYMNKNKRRDVIQEFKNHIANSKFELRIYSPVLIIFILFIISFISLYLN